MVLELIDGTSLTSPADLSLTTKVEPKSIRTVRARLRGLNYQDSSTAI
jgi:hypothetical protein